MEILKDRQINIFFRAKEISSKPSDRKNVIVATKGEVVTNEFIEVWGSLKEVCEVHNLKYHTLKSKKFPIEKDGWLIRRIPFKQKQVIKMDNSLKDKKISNKSTERKNVIVVTKGGAVTNEFIEVWGSLKEVCDVHNFKYNTLKSKKFPIEKDGWLNRRIPFKQKQVIKTIKVLTYQPK